MLLTTVSYNSKESFYLEMQWKWNAWLHIPHATVHSSDVAEAWLAWHSMHRSMMWFRQMAQLSTTMSQAHRATAFHFLTSNLWLKKHTTDEFSNCTNNLEVKLNLKVAPFPLKFGKLRKTHENSFLKQFQGYS